MNRMRSAMNLRMSDFAPQTPSDEEYDEELTRRQVFKYLVCVGGGVIIGAIPPIVRVILVGNLPPPDQEGISSPDQSTNEEP